MKKMKTLFISITLNHTKKILFFTVLIQLLMVPSFKLIKENFDIKIWFNETSKSYQKLEELEKRFGNDESVLIAINNPKGIFNSETLSIIEDITTQMWKAPQVIRVNSITNFNWIESIGDEIEVGPFFEGVTSYSKREIQKKGELAVSHPILRDYLISADGKTAVIFANIRRIDGTHADYASITFFARKLVKKYEGQKNLTIKISGQVPLNYSFKEAAEGDLFLIFPLLLLFVIIYLLFVFRSKVGIIYPFAVIGATIITTMGLGFYLGDEINNITATVPLLLVAICLADSIHLLSSYFQFISIGEDRKTAIISSIKKNFKPTVLTSLSTIAGFLALMTTDLGPIVTLGKQAALGTFFAWFYTYILLGPVLLPFKVKENKFFKHMQDTDDQISNSLKLSMFIKKFQKSILLVVFSFFIGSLYLASHIIPNSNPYKYFKENSRIQIANNYVIEKFGGNQGIEIIIDSQREDGIKNPSFLKKVEAYKTYIEANPRILKSNDFINILKKINQALHGGEERFYKIPETKKQVAESIFFYSLGLPQGMDLNNLMDVESRRLRFSLLWSYQDSRESSIMARELEQKAQDLGLNVIITGKNYTYQVLVDKVVNSFFTSLLSALLVVTLLLSFSFKSIRVGLFSLIPNIVPLVFGLAFIETLGIYLDLGTCMVFAITLGVAVDDTIHFISGFDKYSLSIKNKQKRMAQVFKTTGNALFVTTMVLIVSFSSLAFGAFVPNVNFGITCAFVLFVALVLDLIFLPALLFLDIFSFFEKKDK